MTTCYLHNYVTEPISKLRHLFYASYNTKIQLQKNTWLVFTFLQLFLYLTNLTIPFYHVVILLFEARHLDSYQSLPKMLQPGIETADDLT